MKSYHDLAWKELKAHKVTSILIWIAIVLATLMTTVIGQSWGTLKDLREKQAGGLNGYRYATFHNITEKQKLLIEIDDRLSFVGSNIILGTSRLKNSVINLQIREYDENGLLVYPMITEIQEGRLPQKSGEIALPEDALKFLDFSGNIGDVIQLNLNISLLQSTESAYEYQANFILCGILKSNYIGYSTGTITGIVGEGSAATLLPIKFQVYSTDFRTINKKGLQKVVHDLADKLSIDEKRIQYNWLYLNALGIAYDKEDTNSSSVNGFSYMIMAGFLIGILVLLAAGLVIYNILKIVVEKQIKEFGTLRAIGGQKGQLYLVVTRQIILICIIGIPFGAFWGLSIASTITKAATSLFSPEIFMVQSATELDKLILQNSTGKPLLLLSSGVITLVFAFIAGIPAARYAARVSPIISMSGTRRNIKRIRCKDKKIRNFEAFYARLNMQRNLGRTSITILSLVMSITVFVAIQSFSYLLDISQEVQKMHLGDYSITNDVIGFSPYEVDDLKSQEGVIRVSTLKYSLYTQDKDGSLLIDTDFSLKPGEALHIVGLDEERLRTIMPTLTEKDMQAIKYGDACLITNPIAMSFQGNTMETSFFTLGDKIFVENMELTVIGNTAAVVLDNEGFVNGIQVVVFDTVYDKLTGKTSYSELYLSIEDDADIQFIEQKIENICNKTPGSRWLSYRSTDKQLEESFMQINMLAWGLIFIIGLIGLLNIINTTYTNIQTRIGEIGMQRAIGMSTASLYKTFLWEGVYYGIIAAVIGSIAGYICTIIIAAATIDQLKLVALPSMTIFQVAFVSIAACLIATFIPLRQIAKMSIVDSIDIVE